MFLEFNGQKICGGEKYKSKELKIIKKNEIKTKYLFQLNPITDNQDILRVGGRVSITII
jgi:hypothetical protein